MGLPLLTKGLQGRWQQLPGGGGSRQGRVRQSSGRAPALPPARTASAGAAAGPGPPTRRALAAALAVDAQVARRVGLDLVGVNLPGHFFIAPADPELEFLVDAFNGGR